MNVCHLAGNLGGAAGMGLESLMSEIHDRREETDRLSEQLDVQRQHFKQVIIIMILDSLNVQP